VVSYLIDDSRRKRARMDARSLELTRTSGSSLDVESTGLLGTHRPRTAEAAQKESWLSLAEVLLEQPLNGSSSNNHGAPVPSFMNAKLKHAEDLISDSYELIRQTETRIRLSRYSAKKIFHAKRPL
jgi:hypothetical protein